MIDVIVVVLLVEGWTGLVLLRSPGEPEAAGDESALDVRGAAADDIHDREPQTVLEPPATGHPRRAPEHSAACGPRISRVASPKSSASSLPSTPAIGASSREPAPALVASIAAATSARVAWSVAATPPSQLRFAEPRGATVEIGSSRTTSSKSSSWRCRESS